MRILFSIIFILLSNTAFSCENELPCEMKSMEIFLPDTKRYPASNIRIEKFNFESEEGNVSHKISLEELYKIQEALDKIALKAFAESNSNFEVIAVFRISTDSVIDFKMYTSGGDKEHEMLSLFKSSALKLKNFKAIKDEVFVVIHYLISPSGA